MDLFALLRCRWDLRYTSECVIHITEGSREPKHEKFRNASFTQQSSEQVEQLYCICRNVEEGLMIGCDNDCPYECFPVGCVGLDCIPQGEWYCADCVNQIN